MMPLVVFVLGPALGTLEQLSSPSLLLDNELVTWN
jgi:hypothetical protein